ncbi:MAG: hypothetical protein JJE09_08500 [Bacteroidia bacterium]|nr:hypothetical protein [Bacteroidia bacterium]
MESAYDTLKRFFERLKRIGFFERLFGWGGIKSQMIDAYGDLQKLLYESEIKKSEISKLENAISIKEMSIETLRKSKQDLASDSLVNKEIMTSLTKQNEDRANQLSTLSESNKNYLRRGTELSNEVATLKQRLEQSERELQKVMQQNTEHIKDDEFRNQEYAKSVNALNKIQDKLQNDRNKELEERKNAEIERIRKLRETWGNHQDNVKHTIKTICAKYTIEYVDKVPFKGEPDNTLKISNEFIVFDAKSPGGEDLSNFRQYIKNQAESVKKYVKEPDVKKEIFLVVPTNTLEILDQVVFRLADYNVFVVSLDSLEPIILSLQKIEEYEFADQLSPEERENICRVLGKFVHLSKRRIQIDGFFTKQFFELVYRSEADLPKDILEKVAEFEKAEKLNPPIERRAKQISVKELEQETTKLKSEAEAKGIMTQESILSSRLNKLPLYRTETEDSMDEEQGKLF